MLNLYQRAIEDTLLDGYSAAWVTERQAGKTFIAHHVAPMFKSVAYICPSWPMVQHHVRNYTNMRGRIAYYPATSPDQFVSRNMSGYDLMVVDDFEHVPMHLLEQVSTFRPNRLLLLATRWNNFMVKSLPLRTNDELLNEFITQPSFQHLKLFVG